MDGRTRVAWNLRRIRVERGVSQEALAVDADVDRTYVSGIERGNFNPTVDLLDRFARALGIDVVELLTRPSPDEQAPKPMRGGRRSTRP